MFLTTPPRITDQTPLCVTGNEYISLPAIGPAGEIFSLNTLHLGHRGLLEFSGAAAEPLLAPYLSLNGAAVNLAGKLTWSYTLDWIPRFTGAEEDLCTFTGEIAAPPGRRGCCCRLAVTNTSRHPLKVEAGWRGSWAGFNHIIFNRRAIGGAKKIGYDGWTKSLVLEARSGLPLAALALALEPEPEQGWRVGEAGEGTFSAASAMRLEPGAAGEIVLYLAVNLEADGAGTTAVDLRRRGAAALFRETGEWLGSRRLVLADRALEGVLNRNLFFNYFFALGRALDTDDLVPVTSRSPRYYVSAAYWGRDALLWSFPGLLLADRETARELLLNVFRRHLAQAGEHAHYITGVVLYPGFELDQLAAHLLALERYEHFTGDRSLPGEKAVKAGLALLVQKAEAWRDPETGLYGTFLDPSDDPVLYPFLVYDNALLERGFAYLGALQAEGRWAHPVDCAGRAAELRRAIYRHGVVEGPRGPIFAWAVDGKGRYQLYDNPPGSLQLLAHYRFCSMDDPVFCNTAAWIRSGENPYFHGGAAFEEAGSLHCGNPWPMAACNDLLALNRGGADFLRRAPMDHGFCCETVDPETGRATTGAAFASAAGFLAYALWVSRNRK
jgi:hypothetical protein